MWFHYVECKKVKLTSTRQWYGGYLGLGGGEMLVGRVQTLSCKMTASWGGVCSTLTVVNPILLLHAGNLSRESVVSVFTTHRTWAFGGDGCVGSWIVINISQGTRVT